MAGPQKLSLEDLFSESNITMQSSTIYKALRGDGMRVTPLARSRNSKGKSQPSHPTKSESRPGSYKPEKGRVAAIKSIFESQAIPENTVSHDVKLKTKPPNRLAGSNQPEKKLTATVRRELTPVSESSTKRVPFRSTKLERPVSRASLKEDGNEKKPKPLRKTIDTKALQKKSLPLFPIKPDLKGEPAIEPRSRISTNITQTRHAINKRRLVARKKIGVIGRATVIAGKPVRTKQEPPVIPRKEEAKKTETGQKALVTKAPKPTPKLEPKLPPLDEAPRVSSLPKTPASRASGRNSIVREVVTKTKITSPASPAWKKLWIPSETRESFNQFCPDTKAKKTAVRRQKPSRGQKKKKKVQGDVMDGRNDVLDQTEVPIVHTAAKSKFDNTTEEESSGSDEEEARRMKEMQKRKEMKKKSLDFFSQFKYSETLRKSTPKIIYTSEILEKSDADVKRRLSEIEVRMRLSRLNESVSKIKDLVPKWSGMLLATKDETKMEKIEKTLLNAERIMDGKVDKAKEMLEKYLSLVKTDQHLPPTEEMEDIERLSELVQLDMDSLERMFDSYERQLQQELDEPTSVSL